MALCNLNHSLADATRKLTALLRMVSKRGELLRTVGGVPKHVIDSVPGDMARLSAQQADQVERPLIALIGMVNAGKSAIGNILLNAGESAVFPESTIRETSTPAIVDLDSATRIADLPGLGSVLASADDAAVRAYTRRAAVVLLVISVDTNITRHLHDFLQNQIEPRQRLVIVLNKIDTHDVFPDSHRDKILQQCSRFLLDGDDKTGFPGIRRLFAYDVPVVPFSVRHVRLGQGDHLTRTLRGAITQGLHEAAAAVPWQRRAELLQICANYEPLQLALQRMSQRMTVTESSLEVFRDSLFDVLATEWRRAITCFVQMDRACWEEMQRLPAPSTWSKLFETAALGRAKSALHAVMDRSASQIQRSVAAFFRDFRATAIDLASVTVPELGSVEALEADAAIAKLAREIAYVNWDVHDDVYFRDREVSSASINDRTNDALTALGDAVRDTAVAWAERVSQQVTAAFEPDVACLAALREASDALHGVQRTLIWIAEDPRPNASPRSQTFSPSRA